MFRCGVMCKDVESCVNVFECGVMCECLDVVSCVNV